MDCSLQGSSVHGILQARISEWVAIPFSTTTEARGGGWEEQPHAKGQGRQPGAATLGPRKGAAAERSYPTPEARGGGREDQPHVQEVVAAWAQEGPEELSHIEGQEGRW